MSGGLGVAFEGLWQIDIQIGSDGSGDDKFCETFYLAERSNLNWGPQHYGDGSSDENGRPRAAYFGREIDIMETRWTPHGVNLNLPTGGGTGWNPNPVYTIDNRIRNNASRPMWADVGGAPTSHFITFGCLIRNSNLWMYGYDREKQWYCTSAIPKNNSTYAQKYPFVPYIGTWIDRDIDRSVDWRTKYRNFIYLPPDDTKIKDRNPSDNPDDFGWALIPPEQRS